MPRALKVCPVTNCPELVESGRCAAHTRIADRQRGTAAQRGYSGRGHRGFRASVLRRDPICVIDGCYTVSTDADHWPRGRKELARLGLNPNDPAYGRGLCSQHHKQETAQHQPGGWNVR